MHANVATYDFVIFNCYINYYFIMDIIILYILLPMTVHTVFVYIERRSWNV